jgi:hypothetical protein
MSSLATTDAATVRRRFVGAAVAVLVTALALAGLSASAYAAGPASKAQRSAAKIATTISGFPDAMSPVGTYGVDEDWSVTARVGGPVGRPVRLEHEGTFKWGLVTVVKTGRRGAVKITVKDPGAGSYRLVVPAHGRYAARVSGVKRFEFIVVPQEISVSFSGRAGHVEWRGLVTLRHVYDKGAEPYSSAGGFYYEVDSISGTWNATHQADPDGTTYSGSGSITLANIDMGYSRDFNFWDPFPTFTSPSAGGRYNFGQRMPYGQEFQVTATRPAPEPPLTIHFSVAWIWMNGFPVEEGYPLPSAVDLDHVVGSYTPVGAEQTTSWDLLGDDFRRFYYTPNFP